MLYEFTTKDGKKPDPNDVPTRISVGNNTYDVKDFCVEAPARFKDDLALHGFKPRIRPNVTVRGEQQAAPEPPEFKEPAEQDPPEDAEGTSSESPARRPRLPR